MQMFAISENYLMDPLSLNNTLHFLCYQQSVGKLQIISGEDTMTNNVSEHLYGNH